MHARLLARAARPSLRIRRRPLVVTAAALVLAAAVFALAGALIEWRPAALDGASGIGRQSGEALAPMAPDAYPGSAVNEQAGVAATSAGGDGWADSEALGGVQTRPVIQTGSVDITVRSVIDAFEAVRAIAGQHGGLVSDSTFTSASEQRGAQLTLRVPADRFGDVITQLRTLAVDVRTVSTSSRDVADQLTDLDATLRNLRAVEARYIALLDRAVGIGDILQVQDRLNQVRLQIDRTEARRQLLASQAEMSTLTVTLRPADGAAAGTPGPLLRVREAWADSLQLLQEVATLALVAAVYAWWIIALALVAVLLVRRVWRAGGARPSA